MPPAFVLSQDQTLKFVSQYSRHEPKPANRKHRTSGADTCTCKTYGYVRTCIGIDLFTAPVAQRPTGPGAVAHMSLHQNRQCQRSNTDKKPGQPVIPRFLRLGREHVARPMSVTRAAGEPVVRCGERPSKSHPRFGQHPFFVKIAVRWQVRFSGAFPGCRAG